MENNKKRIKTWIALLLSLILTVGLTAGFGVQAAQERGWGPALPAKFDLRDAVQIPAVPDQGNLSTCWAFASLTALSTTLPESPAARSYAVQTALMDGPGSYGRSLSADHMSLQASCGSDQNYGGDISMSMAYLLAWKGPVTEERDPYGDGVSPKGLPPVFHVQGIEVIEAGDRRAIKEAVMNRGGVQSSLCFPVTDREFYDQYYREDTASFYYNGEEESNHDVVIIGWDDQYPRENFKEGQQPENDGAFLCMNSWGQSFGMDGCFYVSYEDSRLGTYNVSYSSLEGLDNYDRIYQSDLCGWIGQLGFGGSTAWFANVYETKNDEIVKAAGFYATAPDMDYEVYLAPYDGEDSLSRGTLAARGRLKRAGFQTVPLGRGLYVNAGESFAVIVKAVSHSTTQPVAVEYDAGKGTKNVDIKDGRGYISLDGMEWISTEKREKCNVCLKAYTLLQETGDVR